MKCLGCANAVHNALNQLEGVLDNQAVLEENKVTLYSQPNARPSLSVLEETISSLGFSLEGIAESESDEEYLPGN